jgi:hypothetical protein
MRSMCLTRRWPALTACAQMKDGDGDVQIAPMTTIKLTPWGLHLLADCAPSLQGVQQQVRSSPAPCHSLLRGATQRSPGTAFQRARTPCRAFGTCPLTALRRLDEGLHVCAGCTDSASPPSPMHAAADARTLWLQGKGCNACHVGTLACQTQSVGVTYRTRGSTCTQELWAPHVWHRSRPSCHQHTTHAVTHDAAYSSEHIQTTAITARSTSCVSQQALWMSRTLHVDHRSHRRWCSSLICHVTAATAPSAVDPHAPRALLQQFLICCASHSADLSCLAAWANDPDHAHKSTH